MESTAFARARRFLNYNVVAKWSAHAAAVGTGVFYVALLVVLGLFADLMVNRGRLPAYTNLSPGDRQAFREQSEELLKDPDRILRAIQDLLNVDAGTAQTELAG